MGPLSDQLSRRNCWKLILEQGDITPPVGGPMDPTESLSTCDRLGVRRSDEMKWGYHEERRPDTPSIDHSGYLESETDKELQNCGLHAVEV
jgi:hypothetical protein